MKYDYKTLYEKNAAFLCAVPLRKRLLKILDIGITLLFVFAYGYLVWHAWNEKAPATDLVALLFVPFLALFIATILQIAIDRPRPFSESGANIEPLYTKQGSGKSFPSRHLTCAFSIATVCLPSLSLLSGMLYVFALLLAYVRFSLGWHYPSDLCGGIAIGTAIGGLIFIL